MTAKIKFAAVLTALTVAAAVTLPSTDAEARGRGGLLAAGLIGGAILGAAVAGNAYGAPAYSYGGGEYRQCRFVAQYDGWGNYMGRTRICSYY